MTTAIDVWTAEVAQAAGIDILTTGVIYGLARRKRLALAGKDAGAKKLKLKLA